MYICESCGYKSIKWLGRCPNCASWESFAQEKTLSQRRGELFENKPPLLLKDVRNEEYTRINTGLREFDRILGGGVIRGEVILVGGEPGVGKSTLLLEVADTLSDKEKVLYVSGEESFSQIAFRAQRLGIKKDKLYLLSEDNLQRIYEYIREYKFTVVIIDSIQVMYHPEIEGTRGSLAQVRGCAEFLTRIAKYEGIIFFIVGHITKEGVIAGPKLLEHIVDCVLYFESENLSHYRLLRATKNRFGSTGELGVFEMTSLGIKEVQAFNDIFLPHKDKSVVGSCISCVVEGLKPMLIELQALVSRSSFGIVRRRALGFDINRFHLLVATIEKRLKISLANQDIFLNVAGGIKITDPAADLAVVLAIISSYKEKELLVNSSFIGEIGLVGELRPVSNIELRLKEVAKAGFKKCFIPEGNMKELRDTLSDFKIVGIESLKDILSIMRR